MTQPVFYFPQGVADDPQSSGWQMQSDANGAGMGSTITGLTLSLWSQWLSAPNVTGGISMGSGAGVGGSNIIFQYLTGGSSPPDPMNMLCFPQFFINARNHGTLRINNGEWVSTGSPFWNWTDEGGTLYATSLQVHYLVSINFTAGTVQVYCNDGVVAQSFGTISAGSIDNTATPWLVHFGGDAGSAFGDVWMVNQAIDLSVTANRRQFINADLTAVPLPSDGSVTISSSTVTPQVYFHTTFATGPTDFVTNHGSGGTWSMTSGTMGWPLAGYNNYYDNGPNPTFSIVAPPVPPGYIWYKKNDGYWNNNYYALPQGFQNPFTFVWSQPIGGYPITDELGYLMSAIVNGEVTANFGQNPFNYSVPPDYQPTVFSPGTGDPETFDHTTIVGGGSLSNGNLTFTSSGGMVTIPVIDAWYHLKWYWEYTVVSGTVGGGAMQAGADTTDYLATASFNTSLDEFNGGSRLALDGTIYNNDVEMDPAFPSVATDDVLSFALWLVGTQPPPPPPPGNLQLVTLYAIDAPADVFAIENTNGGDFGDSWGQMSLSVWCCENVVFQGGNGVDGPSCFLFDLSPTEATITLTDGTNTLFTGHFVNPGTVNRQYNVCFSVDTEAQTYTFYGNSEAWTPTVSFPNVGDITQLGSATTWVVTSPLTGQTEAGFGNLWADPSYVDFSDAPTLAKFVNPDGTWVDVGYYGNIPTGSYPTLYLTVQQGNDPTDIYFGYGQNGGQSGWANLNSGVDPTTGEPYPETVFDLCAAPIVTTLGMGDLICIESIPPQRNDVTLRWSDDAGASWSNGILRSLGNLGQYSTTPTWFRLGMSRNRVVELSWSGAAAAALQGVFVEFTVAET